MEWEGGNGTGNGNASEGLHLEKCGHTPDDPCMQSVTFFLLFRYNRDSFQMEIEFCNSL